MTMELKFVGVLIACIGNALIGVSFPVMKLAHNRNSESLPYFKLRLWWIANLLMILGEIGNLAAYTLARPALISPLGAVSVVVNGPASWIILQEPLGLRGCLGALFCILGGVGIVHVTAGQADDGAFVTVEQFQAMASTRPFMLYLTFIVAISAALMMSKRKHFLVYLLICSFLGAVTVLSIKGFTSFIVISLGAGPNQFAYPLPWVLIPVLLVSMAIQVPVSCPQPLQRSAFVSRAAAGALPEQSDGRIRHRSSTLVSTARHMRRRTRAHLPQVVPPYYCLFTGSAVMGSALLYKDLDNTSTQDMLVFCVSLLCVAIGVALVAKRDGASGDGSPENDLDRDQFDNVGFGFVNFSHIFFRGV